MRKIGAMLAFVSVLMFHGRAPALAQPVNVTQVADTPAATLLLPYFEVALPKKPGAVAKGLTTLFSINNASATAILAHTTIWSDLAVPVVQFNVYLTGYDVQTIDLRDVLNGHFPQTATAGGDPMDTISPKGEFSQDINFASCNPLNQPANIPPPDLSASEVSDLQAALSGKSSATLGGCAGLDHGDNVARGFVTVDTVNNCTTRFPDDPSYYGGGGDLTDQNTLWGDYYFVNLQKKVTLGDPLVSIVADNASTETSVAGQYTFYGRFNSWSASDNREPLSTSFAARYITAKAGKLFAGGTSMLVWRDPKVVQAPFTCGTPPGWYPLGEEGIAAFDEQEHAENPIAPNAFPAAAQRVLVGSAGLPVSFASGWLFLNLNTAVALAGSNPPEDPNAAQAWVSVVHDSKGLFTVGNRAVQLDSATNASHFTPTVPP